MNMRRLCNKEKIAELRLKDAEKSLTEVCEEYDRLLGKSTMTREEIEQLESKIDQEEKKLISAICKFLNIKECIDSTKAGS